MTDKELMQMALDALYEWVPLTCKREIEALCARLAQPEPEPVAYWRHTSSINQGWNEFSATKSFDDDIPLYTAPPQRKPLTYEQIKTRTDEQIEATFKICGGRWNGDHWVIEDADLHPFVRTIEGADLNTLRAISDEYNAWIKHHAAGHSYDDFLAKRESAPPQREWQGLTDEEVVNRANAEVFAEAFARGVAWAELKLKEKNT